MTNYASEETLSTFRASLFRFSVLWNRENDRATVEEVLPLAGAWVAIIYREPGTDGPLGFVVDLNDFVAGFDEDFGTEEAVQEILQSIIFDPSGPGRTSDHPRLRAVAAAFPGVTWHGEFSDLPVP